MGMVLQFFAKGLWMAVTRGCWLTLDWKVMFFNCEPVWKLLLLQCYFYSCSLKSEASLRIQLAYLCLLRGRIYSLFRTMLCGRGSSDNFKLCNNKHIRGPSPRYSAAGGLRPAPLSEGFAALSSWKSSPKNTTCKTRRRNLVLPLCSQSNCTKQRLKYKLSMAAFEILGKRRCIKSNIIVPFFLLRGLVFFFPVFYWKSNLSIL